MTDPTGTVALRRSFLAEGNRRLARVRSLTHSMLVEHDLMQTRSEPVAQFLPHPGHRLSVFADWFERTVNAQLLGDRWWERYLARAYDSGLVAGNELVKGNGSIPPGRSSLPAVYAELSSRELGGIAAALVQQVSRQAGGAAIVKQKPQLLYRAVLGAIRKVGMARLRLFVNGMTVRLHNAGRLAHFRASGVTRVGIVSERLELRKPSRFLKYDHAALHDALSAEQRARKLLREQQQQREEEQAQREAELQAEMASFEAEVAAQMAGAQSTVGTLAQAQEALTAAQARAGEEIAAIKARTAAQEEKAAAAWKEVLAARKEARAAAYGTKARTREVKAEATAVKVEAKVAAAAGQTEFANILTAGDDLVCQECEDAAAEGPYTLDEAEAMLPIHPNCRCAPVPALGDSAESIIAGEEAAAAREEEIAA